MTEQAKYGSKVQLVEIDQLIPNGWNPNVMSPANEEKLAASIKRHGFFKPALARELSDGRLEIVGGEHRIDVAKRLGYKEIPVINLGKITEKQAKELLLLDNGRYGNDDSLALAVLLDELGTPGELGEFLPYTSADFETIFATSNIALDDLDSLDLDDTAGPGPTAPTTKVGQTHAIMRFKVPVEDVAGITAKVNAVMKRQRFSDEDSLTNAGNALVHIFQDVEV